MEFTLPMPKLIFLILFAAFVIEAVNGQGKGHAKGHGKGKGKGNGKGHNKVKK